MNRPHDGLTAKRRHAIELARIRRHKTLLAPSAPPPVSPGDHATLTHLDYASANHTGFQAALTNPVTGTGTAGKVPKWVTSSTLGNSLFSDDGANPSFQSSGSPKAILDTSTLAIVDSTDKLFYFWAHDPTVGIGDATVVTGYSPTPGTLAQFSLDPSYPTTIQDSFLTYDLTTFTVPDLGGVGARLKLDAVSGGVSIEAVNGGGINTIRALGAGARFEVIGNTTAEVLAINGKGITRGNHTAEGDFILSVAGKTLKVSEAANGKMGTATLVGGTKVVNTTAVTANSRIQLTTQVLGTVAAPKAIAVTARTAGTSFTITSADATDTSTVAWLIVEPS